ncbi:hypothetical protein ACJJTC_016048, partial [Scirpophaga incertulas]
APPRRRRPLRRPRWRSVWRPKMDIGLLTLLQGNINHYAAAQDLLCATAAEWRAGLAIVAEPYYVPPQSDNWLQSTDGTAAIMRRPQGNRGPAVGAAFPRWALTKLRHEVAEEAAMVRAWSDPPAHIAGDVDGMAELFADNMRVVCQAAMPRTRACPDRGQVYWFICADTVEQRIDKLQQDKLGIADSVLTGAKHTNRSKLSIEDLQLLFNMGG